MNKPGGIRSFFIWLFKAFFKHNFLKDCVKPLYTYQTTCKLHILPCVKIRYLPHCIYIFKMHAEYLNTCMHGKKIFKQCGRHELVSGRLNSLMATFLLHVHAEYLYSLFILSFILTFLFTRVLHLLYRWLWVPLFYQRPGDLAQ